LSFRVGSVFTADMFYNKNNEAAGQYRDMGILAVEMETAGIYWKLWPPASVPCLF
jgi:purine-nucleoside phosphorylase